MLRRYASLPTYVEYGGRKLVRPHWGMLLGVWLVEWRA